jgi:hypothetical protein
VAAVERLCDDQFSQRLGENAYARWVHEFHPQRGLANLEGAYRDAVALARKG